MDTKATTLPDPFASCCNTGKGCGAKTAVDKTISQMQGCRAEKNAAIRWGTNEKVFVHTFVTPKCAERKTGMISTSTERARFVQFGARFASAYIFLEFRGFASTSETWRKLGQSIEEKFPHSLVCRKYVHLAVYTCFRISY